MRKSLIMVLAALLVGLPVLGASPGEVKAASCAFSAGGDGSPGDPYIVVSKEDLDCVREDLTASYKLGADIDLSDFGYWTPIGTYDIPFEGAFNGADYAIRGMTILSNADNIGLFGYAHGSTTTISNVRLENVDITSTKGSANVGGLVGAITIDGTISDSSVSGEIIGGAFAAGGLAGQAASGAKLKASSSSVKLNMNSGAGAVGGLVGGISSGAIVEQSYATGDVSSPSGNVGGLVGNLYSTVLDSYATGRVTSNGNGTVGGLIGMVVTSSIVTNNYATGIVSPGTGRAGGLIGDGVMFLPSRVISSYWNSSDNPLALQTLGWIPGTDGAISQSEMKQMATYAGWDSTIWGIQEGTSYPYLTAFTPSLRVNPLSLAYSLEQGSDELAISGTIRDGSIGEPLKVGYVIQNAVDATVTSVVYATYATGGDQAFHFSTTLNAADYPDGTYTLTVIGEDSVNEHLHKPEIRFAFAVDTTAPVISLNGSELIELQLGDTFTDPGATAEDDRDGDVTALIARSGTVDTSQTGTYTLTYEVTDALGHTATKTRTVKVYNSLFPGLALDGLYTMEVEVGSAFVDPGATSSDERDGDLTDQIEISGTVDTGHVGVYSIDYVVRNSMGNQSSTSRRIEVVDTTPPVLTLQGANPMQLEVGSVFADPGATALDVGDGDLTADISVSGAVYANQVGTYTLTYRVQDRVGNKATDAVRTVNVVRTSSPPGGSGTTPTTPSGGNPPKEGTEEGNGGNTSPFVPECLFADIRKHWAESEICKAAKLGIVEGASPYLFRPNGDVTRTEFAVMLLRTLRIEIDEEAGAVPFADRDTVPKWALQAIRTAVAKGILSGYPDGTLRPLQKVNRSEMAAMVSKALKWKAGSERSPLFSDEASIPGWAKEYTAAARERGVLTGRDGNRFAPNELSTRAEAAVVLLRLWKALY